MADIYYNVSITDNNYSISKIKPTKFTVCRKNTFCSKITDYLFLRRRNEGETNVRKVVSSKNYIAHSILDNIEKILTNNKIKLGSTCFDRRTRLIDNLPKSSVDIRSIEEIDDLLQVAEEVKESYGKAYNSMRIICRICWVFQGFLAFITLGLFKTRKQSLDAHYRKVELLQFQNYYVIENGNISIKQKSEKPKQITALKTFETIKKLLPTVSVENKKVLLAISLKIVQNCNLKYKQFHWIRKKFIQAFTKPTIDKIRSTYQEIVSLATKS